MVPIIRSGIRIGLMIFVLGSATIFFSINRYPIDSQTKYFIRPSNRKHFNVKIHHSCIKFKINWRLEFGCWRSLLMTLNRLIHG